MNFMKLKKLMILTKKRVIDLLALEQEYKEAIKQLEKEVNDDDNDQS